jgi:hypothetical protein
LEVYDVKKNFVILLLCLSIISFILPVSSANADYFNDNAVKVVLNGEEIKFEPNAIIWNATTLVPFRQLFETYGAEVDWNQVTKTVTATKGDTKIIITMDSLQAWVNDKEYKLNQAPFIAKDTAYINLRFVSEALGASVRFNKKDKVVNIDWTMDKRN